MKKSLLGVLISLFVFSFYELKAENVCRMESDTAFCSAKNYGKSVAVFGGSLSVFPESEAAKDLWRQQLGMKVTNYGVGGAGFSSLQGKSLQEQVRWKMKSKKFPILKTSVLSRDRRLKH